MLFLPSQLLDDLEAHLEEEALLGILDV